MGAHGLQCKTRPGRKYPSLYDLHGRLLIFPFDTALHCRLVSVSVVSALRLAHAAHERTARPRLLTIRALPSGDAEAPRTLLGAVRLRLLAGAHTERIYFCCSWWLNMPCRHLLRVGCLLSSSSSWTRNSPLIQMRRWTKMEHYSSVVSRV